MEPGPKTVYVRREDVQVWERAEAYAKSRRLPMSALVMTALERLLAAEEAGAEGKDDS